ncbi:unnamed protein product [Caenorhabditis brenneri]
MDTEDLSSEILRYVEALLEICHLITICIMKLVSLLVFPFYVMVYRSMREKEKQTLLAGVAFSIILGPEAYVMFDLRSYIWIGSTPFDHLESSDVISTPVLIQVSYLLCNQKNVEELRKSLSIRKVIKKLFMFMWKRIKREQNRVEPVVQLQIDEMRTTVI